MNNKFAFVFKTEEERARFREMFNALLGELVTHNMKDRIHTHTNDSLYLMLDDKVDMQMRGRSIDDFFFISTETPSEDTMLVLKAATLG